MKSNIMELLVLCLQSSFLFSIQLKLVLNE